jgi:vesicle coat complex subunit
MAFSESSKRGEVS